MGGDFHEGHPKNWVTESNILLHIFGLSYFLLERVVDHLICKATLSYGSQFNILYNGSFVFGLENFLVMANYLDLSWDVTF